MTYSRQIALFGKPGTLISLVTLVVLLLTLLFYVTTQPSHDSAADFSAIAVELASLDLQNPIDYEVQVQPILEQRCVICHGCFDAPCQLKLSSPEGLQRGATEKRVYDYNRISNVPPTRLFVDADSTNDWRSMDFHPVLNEGSPTPRENLAGSVMYRLLQLKKDNPQPDNTKLPDLFTLELDREQTCPTIQTVDNYVHKQPLWGMPYGMPNLSSQEYRTLVTWLAQGTPMPPPPAPSAIVLPQIDRWEKFLNQPSLKSRLMSRYLYEHLFHAHIHFNESPTREFYRLVRSTTPPGQMIHEIPTVRPYDDPGSARFFYRLLPYHPSIVVKNHIVYTFSDQRMARYKALFLDPDYAVLAFPSYEAAIASNPFKTYAAIPTISRYRFLLDDARFFIEGFVKGPVCRGQIALDVIEDQFWVLFFDPDLPVFTNNPEFITKMADDLQIPSDRPNSLNFVEIWTDYWKRQRRYMVTKQDMLKMVGTHNIDHAMNYIWDGDGDNPNAALTVFRHFDSGSVTYGLVGKNPETAWIIDYPLLERIHYLLVAGFNVYGNIVHQINTRIYMDFLRMEGEDNFLVFLPVDQRKAIRDSWYTGLRSNVEKLFTAPTAWLNIKSIDGYQTRNSQNELYQKIKTRLHSVTDSTLAMNRCGSIHCVEPLPGEAIQRVNTAMSNISQLQGERLHSFPDVAFVRVKMDNPAQDLGYSLIRNKAYKNVTSFLADERDRDKSDINRDTMTVLNWLEGSYPNVFFSVAEQDIENFAKRCADIQNLQEYEKFVARYGVRRNSPKFWELSDWFQDTYRKNKPTSSGIFDLNRYSNH